MFRNPKKDRLKDNHLVEQQEFIPCEVCGTPGLTLYEGPGQDKLCRTCQLKEVSYEEGLGYLGRPWTFHRVWRCQKCGYDPRQDIRLFRPGYTPEKQKALWSSQLIGDHIQARKHGGDDSAENIQTLCWICNAAKSMDHDDWHPL